jgi:hypothetical protein
MGVMCIPGVAEGGQDLVFVGPGYEEEGGGHAAAVAEAGPAGSIVDGSDLVVSG